MDSLILYFFRPLWSLDGYKTVRARWPICSAVASSRISGRRLALARGTPWTRLFVFSSAFVVVGWLQTVQAGWPICLAVVG